MKKNSARLTLVLVIVLFAVGFAVREMNRAQQYADIIRVNELTAESVALRDTRFELSLLLSVEAFRLADNYRTRGVLLDGVQANPQLVRYLRESVGRPSSIAFSPDGGTVAAGYFGGEIILWDVATGKPERQLAAKWTPSAELQAVLGDANLGPVFDLMFTPDGKVLMAGIHTLYDDLRIIALWDVSSGLPIAQPLLEKKSPYDLVLSPDGKTLAISEWGNISFWDMETNVFVGKLSIGPYEGLSGLNPMFLVSSPAFSPDGAMLAAISSVNSITFWDMSTLEPVGEPLIVGDLYSRVHVNHIMFHPDGKALLTVSADGTLASVDLETGLSTQLRQAFPIKDSYVLYGQGATFSPDAKLAAINDGSAIRVLDAQTGQEMGLPLTGNKNDPGGMVFNPDGTMLASIGSNGITLWALADQMPLGQIVAENGGSSVAFSPDGGLLAADTFFGDDTLSFAIGLWDTMNHKLIGSLSSENYSDYQHVAFSPNGNIIAAGSGSEIILWDASSHDAIDHFPLGAYAYLSSLAFSPDGKMLAAGHDLEVTLWDLENRKSPRTLEARDGLIESLAFSPNGKMLAVGDASDSITLWDLKTRDSTTWTASVDDVDGLAFSPNGEMLASTSRDGKILLWNANSWEVMDRPFIVPTGSIPSTLAFSPDGKMLVSGNYDNTINLWDVMTQQSIGRGLVGNDWPVGDVAFSPDGNFLATISNKIVLWDVDPRSWIEKICWRVGRNLTRSEWVWYFPGETYRATCAQWPLEVAATPTISP